DPVALAEIYFLRGQIAAILDGADAGEQEFRKLFALQPDHAPPRSSPVLRVPFERARAWIAEHGRLRVEHEPAAEARPPGGRLSVSITSDPLAMVSGIRVLFRTREQEPFARAPAQRGGPVLPPGAVAYYLEAVDPFGNVLLSLGSAERPYVPPPVAARPAKR